MSGKRPTDHLEPNAKRRSDRQLTKDDGSDDEQVVDPGSFARASEDVIRQRKIIKARRNPDAGGGGANPFAGIQLAAPTAPTATANPFAGVSLMGSAGTPAPTPAKKAEPAAAEPASTAAAAEEGKGGEPTTAAADAADAPSSAPAQAAAAADNSNQKEAAAEDKGGKPDQQTTAPDPSSTIKPLATSGGFGALGSTSGGGLAFGSSSGSAFGSSGFGSASGGFGSLAGSSTGGAFSFGASIGTAATSSIFSFSTASATANSTFAAAAASSAAAAGDSSSGAAAASAPAAGGSSAPSLFGATPVSGTPLFGAAPAAAPKVELPGEQAVTTGEEGERTVFSGEGALFEFDAAKQWRERGRGEMRVNIAPSGQGRLVMRQKGNLRLLLNSNLWAEMQVSKMEGGKGVTFACVNHASTTEEPPKKEGSGEGAAEDATAGEQTAAGGNAAAAAAPKLATFALRIKLPELLDQFVAAVNAHKAGGGKKAGDA